MTVKLPELPLICHDLCVFLFPPLSAYPVIVDGSVSLDLLEVSAGSEEVFFSSLLQSAGSSWIMFVSFDTHW